MCRESSTIVDGDEEREQDGSLVRVRDVAGHRGRRRGGRAGRLHWRAVRGLTRSLLASSSCLCSVVVVICGACGLGIARQKCVVRAGSPQFLVSQSGS